MIYCCISSAETNSNYLIYLLIGFDILKNFPPYIPPQEVLCGLEGHQGVPLNPTIVNSQQQHPIWDQVLMPQSIAHENSQYPIQGIHVFK